MGRELLLFVFLFVALSTAIERQSTTNVTLFGRAASISIDADSLLVSVDLNSGTYTEKATFFDLFPLAACYDQESNRYFEVLELHEEGLFYLTVYDYEKSQLLSNISLNTEGQIISSLVYHSERDQLYGIIVEDKAEKSEKTWIVALNYRTGSMLRLNEINSTIFMTYSSTIDPKNNLLYTVINNCLMVFNLVTGDLVRSPGLDETILAATHSFLFLHYQPSTETLFGFSSINSTTRAFFTLNPTTGKIATIRSELSNWDCNFHSYGFSDTLDVFVFGLGSSTIGPATCLDGAVTYFAISTITGELFSQQDVPFDKMTAPQDLVVSSQ